jgi:hypothetical protein
MIRHLCGKVADPGILMRMVACFADKGLSPGIVGLIPDPSAFLAKIAV